jgi:SAM-dependent methyltransferase
MVTETHPRRPDVVEALDSRDLDHSLAATMLSEIALTNVLFGGHAAIEFGLMQLTRDLSGSRPLTILDVGAGGGEVARRACVLLGAHRARAFALDHHRTSAHMCGARGVTPIVGDMRQLPLRPASVDIVIMNLVLHHLTRPQAVTLVAKLNATARIGVVIADLRRSTVACMGFDLAGRMLRLNEVTRRDGVLSIRRGFTLAELADIIAYAGVSRATVRRRLGWRLVACWRTRHEDG